MKKTRLLAFLLTACLATTCFLSGTVAKYSSEANNENTVRVAKWGIGVTDAITMNLFEASYFKKDSNSVNSVMSSNGTDKVFAPGTSGLSQIQIIKTSQTAPEVNYNLTVSVEGSEIADSIKNNLNIQWKLDDTGAWGTWEQLMTAILKMSGNETVQYSKGNIESVTQEYAAGSKPAAFDEDAIHTIYWQWVFETADNNETPEVDEKVEQDKMDTNMGNADPLAECILVITITAEQVD